MPDNVAGIQCVSNVSHSCSVPCSVPITPNRGFPHGEAQSGYEIGRKPILLVGVELVAREGTELGDRGEEGGGVGIRSYAFSKRGMGIGGSEELCAHSYFGSDQGGGQGRATTSRKGSGNGLCIA